MEKFDSQNGGKWDGREIDWRVIYARNSPLIEVVSLLSLHVNNE
jgi:hypothetical protein